MKVYISGAITNNKYHKEQFGAAEKRLKEQGHDVINPAKNQGYTYREYQLMNCDAIYMLTGWENSTGAKLELEYAKVAGLTIMYQKSKLTGSMIVLDKILKPEEIKEATEELKKLNEVLEWETAVANVKTVREIAFMIPWARHLCMTLDNLLKRYESGERTKELYEAMLEVH